MPNLMKMMMLLVASVAFVGVPAIGHAQSAKTAPPPAKQGPLPIPRATFIANMDAQFRLIDADRNNSITAAEIEKNQRAVVAAQNAVRARNFFMQLDTDRNGQISPAEFTKIPMPATKADGRQMVSRFDANKDNAISLVEYRGGTLVNFDRLDADKDGVASTAEMRAAGLGR